MGQSSTKRACFECGDPNHWKIDCPWASYPCVKGCGATMKIYTSTKEWSKGEQFLRCNAQPNCNGFKWVTELANVVQKKEEGKLKLEIKGAIPMSVEGNVSDITELVKSLSLSK